ncbi:MAG: hypothetical protein M1828_003539 [Chrysothrix sp. TS-e1954]|nr:MAG: hypothetical protein M1828_003539 [Chrysothrix sp. TS-e1954]
MADHEFAGPKEPPTLTANLKDVLQDLSRNPHPFVPCPEGVKKRASVALIIRVKPTYSHWPPKENHALPSDGLKKDLQIDQFFEQDWVRWGDPEVLFIKRAARKGDRWQGHVALPGGGRDPEDADDEAAAIRETEEEVGLALSPANAIAVGNLPQRVVSANWVGNAFTPNLRHALNQRQGRTAIMILCPYVFLVTNPNLPPLRLQPTEVGSTHWVPFRALLSPALRTSEYQDVSNRVAGQGSRIRRFFFRSMLGRMVFCAVRLLPSESSYSSSPSTFAPDPDVPASDGVLVSALDSLDIWRSKWLISDPPLHLWGLTLGVIADLLDLLPPHNALTLWDLPTFSTWDNRFIIWLLSYKFRMRTAKEMGEVRSANMPVPDAAGFNAAPMSPTRGQEMGRLAQTGCHGPWNMRLSQSDNIDKMLKEYFNIIRRAGQVVILGRLATIFALALTIWRKRRKT